MGSRKLEVKKHYIFDVDGTLTPSRQVIDSDFAVFFSNFCAENDVYLVTGSDKDFNNQVSQAIEFFTKGVVTNSSFTNFSTIGDSTRINTSIQVIGASSGARIIIPVLIKKNQSSS